MLFPAHRLGTSPLRPVQGFGALRSWSVCPACLTPFAGGICPDCGPRPASSGSREPRPGPVAWTAVLPQGEAAGWRYPGLLPPLCAVLVLLFFLVRITSF